MYTPREPLRLSGLIRGLQGVQICGGCHDSLNPAEQGILTGPWMPEARLRKMLFTCRKASSGRSECWMSKTVVADLSDTLIVWERLAVLGKSIHLFTLNSFR
jgi:hypothetical protein